MYHYAYEKFSPITMQRIWDIINSAKPEDWWRENNLVEWRISLPHDIFSEDPKTNAIVQEFVKPGRLYVQRLEPKTSYFWHRDYARDTSITMGMNVFEKSFTLFGGPMQYKHIHDLEPLYYEPDTAYLIAGNKLHCGINLSDEMRYLLSVSISQPATMESMIEWLKEKFPEDDNV